MDKIDIQATMGWLQQYLSSAGIDTSEAAVRSRNLKREMDKHEIDQDALEMLMMRLSLANVKVMEAASEAFDVQLELSKLIMGEEEFNRVSAEIGALVEADDA